MGKICSSGNSFSRERERGKYSLSLSLSASVKNSSSSSPKTRIPVSRVATVRVCVCACPGSGLFDPSRPHLVQCGSVEQHVHSEKDDGVNDKQADDSQHHQHHPNRPVGSFLSSCVCLKVKYRRKNGGAIYGICVTRP